MISDTLYFFLNLLSLGVWEVNKAKGFFTPLIKTCNSKTSVQEGLTVSRCIQMSLAVDSVMYLIPALGNTKVNFNYFLFVCYSGLKS